MRRGLTVAASNRSEQSVEALVAVGHVGAGGAGSRGAARAKCVDAGARGRVPPRRQQQQQQQPRGRGSHGRYMLRTRRDKPIDHLFELTIFSCQFRCRATVRVLSEKRKYHSLAFPKVTSHKCAFGLHGRGATTGCGFSLFETV